MLPTTETYFSYLFLHILFSLYSHKKISRTDIKQWDLWHQSDLNCSSVPDLAQTLCWCQAECHACTSLARPGHWDCCCNTGVCSSPMPAGCTRQKDQLFALPSCLRCLVRGWPKALQAWEQQRGMSITSSSAVRGERGCFSRRKGSPWKALWP